MIREDFAKRIEAGEIPTGRVRGVILSYAVPEEQDPHGDRVTLRVLESDVAGIEPGAEASLRMDEARDGNFLLRDLQVGYATGGLDPVPVESEVTFEHCARGEDGELAVMAYEIDTIERPEPAPGMGPR